jgi:hypothetical protein
MGNAVLDERTRHELHQRFDELLGRELAVALMSSLPPTGWGDVVTKQHLDLRLDAMEQRWRAELHREIGSLRGELHQEIGSLRGDMAAQTRTLLFGLLAANATFVGLAFAAAKLA